MIVLSFKTKKDKEHLLEKAKKMEEYASMIVDCIEDSVHHDDDDDYDYRRDEHYDRMEGRYGYRKVR